MSTATPAAATALSADVTAFKEEGNKLFRQELYLKAAASYSKALKASTAAGYSGQGPTHTDPHRSYP